MLTYSEAIEKVMIDNGGFAPLKLLYTEIWKYKDKNKITGKTTDKTIQERVQRDERFTRIRLGVWALTEYANTLKNNQQAKTIAHKDAQGMLLEIGNNRKLGTYTPDKSLLFNDTKLGDLSTIEEIPSFTYSKIIKKSARYIDVIWFNSRGFPCDLFEVEHSTDFRSALIKFSELQDFNTNFYCVAPTKRETKFNTEIAKNAFEPIKQRVVFKGYDQIESDYDAALKEQYL